MALMTVFLVVLLAAGALAWRLSLGPLEIPGAATRLANAVSGRDVSIHIGRAELEWAGYKAGSGAPLFLHLGDISVNRTDGAPLARIPDARLVFSLGGLFNGGAPILVSSRNARITGSDSPISLNAGIRLGAAFTLARAELRLTFGPGELGPAGYGEKLRDGRLQLELTPKEVRIVQGVLNLQPFGRSAPVLHVTGGAHADAGWRGAVTLTADAVRAADLRHYWPKRLAPAARLWVTRNITAGTARDARFTFDLSAPAQLSSVRLDNAAGGFDADALRLTWLPGMPPFTALSGRFTLADADDIDITADSARLDGMTITKARMHIAGLSRKVQIASLTVPLRGTLPQAVALLNRPELGLLKSVPLLEHAEGRLHGTVDVKLPLLNGVALRDVSLHADSVLSEVSLALVQGLRLDHAKLDLAASLRSLDLHGEGEVSGRKASLKVAAAFGGNDAARLDVWMQSSVNGAVLRSLGWDSSAWLQGAMPVAVHLATAGTRGRLTVTADLTPAKLSLPVFNWSKPAGQPGRLSFAAAIEGGNFAGIGRIAGITATAPGLDLQIRTDGRAIELTHVKIGGSEGSGRIVAPAAAGQPWDVSLRGSELDLSALTDPHRLESGKPAPAQHGISGPTGIPWRVSAHFDRLRLAQGAGPALQQFDFTGAGQGGFIFRAQAAARLAGQPVTLAIAPSAGTAPGADETLHLKTADGGGLLRALDVFGAMRGGSLDLSARYGVGRPVQGVTRISKFRLLDAPAFAKFLQAATVLGIPEAVSGRGLELKRLIVPFSIDGDRLTLADARAYSNSLGFTAAGTIDLAAGTCRIEGTVVPAYAVNTLPGKIPLIGRLFSPEKGGGLIAMRYRLSGPTSAPKVKVNPLSALTPGFLRGIFGPAKPKAPPVPAR